MHTPQGATRPPRQGSQQSAVWAQPLEESGMHFAATQTPVASGLLCWQTNPGAHTGGGARMFPPQGPPGPETHPQVAAPGTLSQFAPDGHRPPHAPAASAPQGFTHRVAGPGQQVAAPVASAHTHACSHTPATQRSAVQGLPSLQSASVVQPPVGSVVVVVARHRALQNSLGFRHGSPGPQSSLLHCCSTVT
jgi:hypothetical protein